VVKIPDGGVRWPVDVAVAAVVAVLTGMDAWWNQPGTREADGLTYLLVVVSVAAVVVRRRWPVVVAAICVAALTAWYLLGHRGELLNLPSMVALYTVAVQGARRRTVLIGLVAVVWSAGLGWVTGDRSSAPVSEMLWPAAALLLGEVVRGRRELLAEYAAREARAAADREREAHRRVQQERLRIAREFHDVVAHTIAAVNVQTGVAVAAFDQRPDAARAALVQARASSREALQELRATVALLRDAAPGDSTDPCPAPWPARRARGSDQRRRGKCLAAPEHRRAGAAGRGRAGGVPDCAGGSDEHDPARRRRRCGGVGDLRRRHGGGGGQRRRDGYRRPPSSPSRG